MLIDISPFKLILITYETKLRRCKSKSEDEDGENGLKLGSFSVTEIL
jgi:hypothetical protein